MQQCQELLSGIYSGVNKIYNRVSAVPEFISLPPTNSVPGTANTLYAIILRDNHISPIKRVGDEKSIDSFLEGSANRLKADIDVFENSEIGKKSFFGKKSKATENAEKIVGKYGIGKLQTVYAGIQHVLGQNIEDSVKYWVALQEKTGEEKRIGAKPTPEDIKKLLPLLQVMELQRYLEGLSGGENTTYIKLGELKIDQANPL